MGTMLLGGLWHGANWTFVVWGALHAAGIILTRELERSPLYRDRVPRFVKQTRRPAERRGSVANGRDRMPGVKLAMR